MIECQDCPWVGEENELIGPTSSDEPGCPNCSGCDLLEIEEEENREDDLWFDLWERDNFGDN